MKLLPLFVLAVSLSGCAQLMKGELQPVTIKNAKDNTMFTTCSGMVEEWNSCYQKAGKTCPNGYETLEKVESPVGGKRELTFKCN
jgi:hypothetical protein